MNLTFIISIFVVCILVVAYRHAVNYDEKVKLSSNLEKGNIVIIPPKFATGGRIFQIFEWIKVLFYTVIVVFLMVQFYDYLNLLATTCSTLYGFNPNYVREWIGVLVFPMTMLMLAFFSLIDYLQIKPYKDQFYPSPDSQAEYQEVVCQIVDDKLLKEKKYQVVAQLGLTVLMLCLMLWSVPEPLFPISEANEAYQQACLADIDKTKNI